MDVGSVNATTNTAASLTRKEAEENILQRSLEKQDNVPVEQRAGEAKQVEQPSSERQGRIDFYA